MASGDGIQISGEIVQDRPSSYLFYDGAKSVYLPKSQVKWDEDAGEMTMPEWLAMEKGLI